jgi:DNA polymerase III delta subunit
MPTATPAAVRRQIAAGQTESLYLLIGEDDVEKSALAAQFADIVEDGLRAFNVERIHAGEMTTGDRLVDGVAGIIAAARTMPMLVPRRVVTVTQAEMLLAPKRESDAATRALEQLEALFQKPEPHTTLVFVAGTVDKRGRMFRLLAKSAVVVECGAIATEADAERWVRTRVAAAGAEIEPAGARRLAERAGADVRRLRGEVDRLLLYALGKPRITLEDVIEVAGPAALQDEWAMPNAIEGGQGGEALRQLALMFETGAPPEKILGQLGWLVRTRFPAFGADTLTAAVQALFRTDLALKSSGGEPRILLERLVVELCGTRTRSTARGGGPARQQF